MVRAAVKRAFAYDATVFDGGCHQLVRRIALERSVGGRQSPGDLMRLNLTHREVVADAHRLHLDAGADIISTNTVACAKRWMGSSDDDDDFDIDEWEECLRAGTEIAREVAAERSSSKKRVRVLGVIPTVGRGVFTRKGPPPPDGSALGEDRALMENVGPIVDAMVESMRENVDIWFLDSVTSGQEAKLVGHALSNQSVKPIWVDFKVEGAESKDSSSVKALLPNGESIDSAIRYTLEWTPTLEGLIMSSGNRDAVLAAINDSMLHIPYMVEVGGRLQTVDALGSEVGAVVGDPDEVARCAKRWWQANARLVAGQDGLPENIGAIYSSEQAIL